MYMLNVSEPAGNLPSCMADMVEEQLEDDGFGLGEHAVLVDFSERLVDDAVSRLPSSSIEATQESVVQAGTFFASLSILTLDPPFAKQNLSLPWSP